MANVTVTLPPSARNTRSARSFKRFIGQPGKSSQLDRATGILVLFEGDQATIDAALVNYIADQANIDKAHDATVDADNVGRLQREFAADVILNAVVEVVRVELNDLRAEHTGKPAIQPAAFDALIRAKIANP